MYHSIYYQDYNYKNKLLKINAFSILKYSLSLEERQEQCLRFFLYFPVLKASIWFPNTLKSEPMHILFLVLAIHWLNHIWIVSLL
jgi:hypothetical protein